MKHRTSPRTNVPPRGNVTQNILDVLKHPIVIVAVTAVLTNFIVPRVTWILGENERRQAAYREFVSKITDYVAAVQDVTDIYKNEITNAEQIKSVYSRYNDASHELNRYVRSLSVISTLQSGSLFDKEGLDAILSYRDRIEGQLTKISDLMDRSATLLSPELWDSIDAIDDATARGLPSAVRTAIIS